MTLRLLQAHRTARAKWYPVAAPLGAKLAGSVATALMLGLPLPAARAQDVSALAWLAGCWAADNAEAGSGEHWLPPAGGTMLGVSRTVRNGRTVAHEFMQLRAGADGKLAFIALPSGQKEASFAAVAVDAESALFENPDHDFPQRVRYTLQGGQRLLARIEGLRSGRLRTIDFPLRRVACDTLGVR